MLKELFITHYNFCIMSKKRVLSVLVLIIFTVIAVASSSSRKVTDRISDETIRDAARTGAGLFLDLSN